MTPPQVEASAAADGTLVYLAGQSQLSRFTWYDRNGKRLGTVGPATTQVGVALSPDANSVTSLRYLNGSGSLWLYDLARGSESRVTPPGSSTDGNGVVWSPDGNLLWFNMEGPEGHGLYQADLKGGPLHLVERSDPAAPAQAPSDRSRDGKLLVYTKIDPKTQGDIWYAPVESGKPLFKKAVKVLTCPR
jgi:Tol biopolymer transport system component